MPNFFSGFCAPIVFNSYICVLTTTNMGIYLYSPPQCDYVQIRELSVLAESNDGEFALQNGGNIDVFFTEL